MKLLKVRSNILNRFQQYPKYIYIRERFFTRQLKSGYKAMNNRLDEKTRRKSTGKMPSFSLNKNVKIIYIYVVEA